ncbi:MAG: NAD-dependent epimerase/dehydratase family protein [Myxococcota bacterium]
MSCPPRTSQKKTNRILLVGCTNGLSHALVNRLQEPLHVLGTQTPKLTGRTKKQDVIYLPVRLSHTIFSQLKKERFDSIIHAGFLWPSIHTNTQNAALFNIQLLHRLLRLACDVGVRQFILISAAYLYGPSEHTCGWLTEESALHCAAHPNSRLSSMACMDTTVQAFLWQHKQIATTILRPVYTLGPQLNNAESQYLRLHRVPTVLGYDPMIQVVHQNDVVRAVKTVLRKRTRGVFHIVGDNQAPLMRLIQASGGSPLPMPAWMVERTGWPSSTDGLRFACLVSGQKAQEQLGYRPRMDMIQTLRALRADSS